MVDQDFLDDQTLFAQDEPNHLSSRKKRKIEDEVLVKKPPFMIYLGVAVGVLLVVLLLVAMALKNKNTPPPAPIVTPTPTVIPQDSSQIDQMMNELRAAVSKADPSQTSLSFPPVADQIKISQ